MPAYRQPNGNWAASTAAGKKLFLKNRRGTGNQRGRGGLKGWGADKTMLVSSKLRQ